MMKFVSALSAAQIAQLKDLHRNGSTTRVRFRAHSILLSQRGYTINQIAAIYEVHRDTVSGWIAAWEQDGVASLPDQPRSGRPPKLTAAEQEIALRLLKETPRSIKTVLAKLYQETGKQVSEWTVKRLAKQNGKVWKRIRKSLRSKRDKAEFKQAQQEIAVLKAQAAQGEIDLRYFDEVGFNLTPVVPYAWQAAGETIEIPTAKSDHLTVLGFYNTDNQFTEFTVSGCVNSDIVIACFEQFSATLAKETVVIIDNASIHTSKKFKAQLSTWAKKGLQVKYLPSYAPELNLIEILWRFIKYSWLPFTAYQSFQALRKALQEILAGVGSKYCVNFA